MKNLEVFRSITVISLFCGLSLYPRISKADNGCLINTTAGPKVYYVPQVAGSTVFFAGGGTVRYGNLPSCQAGNSPSNSYYVLTSPAGSACYANYDGSGSQTSPLNYSQIGNQVTFNVANCPIDDYAWILLVTIAFIGYLLLCDSGSCLFQQKSFLARFKYMES